VVLSDSVMFMCGETSNFVSLSVLSEIFQGCALSLPCVCFGLESHLSLCLQCMEQGFSHIHVLLKMQCLIQVSLNLSCLTKCQLKEFFNVHAALDSMEEPNGRTEGPVGSQPFL